MRLPGLPERRGRFQSRPVLAIERWELEPWAPEEFEAGPVAALAEAPVEANLERQTGWRRCRLEELQAAETPLGRQQGKYRRPKGWRLGKAAGRLRAEPENQRAPELEHHRPVEKFRMRLLEPQAGTSQIRWQECPWVGRKKKAPQLQMRQAWKRCWQVRVQPELAQQALKEQLELEPTAWLKPAKPERWRLARQESALLPEELRGLPELERQQVQEPVQEQD